MHRHESCPTDRSHGLNTLLRRTLLALLLLVAVALAGIAFVYAASAKRIGRDYAIELSLPPADRGLLDEGRHLARSRGCADCHADDFGGRMLVDGMPFARLVGSNLTRMPDGHENRSMHDRRYAHRR